jgi:hypothetical protein
MPKQEQNHDLNATTACAASHNSQSLVGLVRCDCAHGGRAPLQIQRGTADFFERKSLEAWHVVCIKASTPSTMPKLAHK